MRRYRTIVMLGVVLAAAACTGGSDAVPAPGDTPTIMVDTATTSVATTVDATPTPSADTVPTDVGDSSDSVTAPDTAEADSVATAPTTQVAPAATADPTTTAPPPTEPATTTAPAPTPPPTAEPTFLREGSEGPEVAILQLKLITLGYLPPGADTGVFGSDTNRAVLEFQGQYGLIVDGLVGPETDRSLTAAALSVDVESG